MELIDNELKLRAIECGDAKLLQEMINDPAIESMVVGWSLPVSQQKQMDWINSLKPEDMKFTIQLEQNAIGMASITGLDYKNSTAGLNIKIKSSEHKRKGLGTRIIKLLVNYCYLELNLNCLTANVLDYNIASQKLFEKCGFKQDGVLRSRVYKGGKYHNIIAYSLLRNEYES